MTSPAHEAATGVTEDRRAVPGDAGGSAAAHPLLLLQRGAGNAAVTARVQRLPTVQRGLLDLFGDRDVAGGVTASESDPAAAGAGAAAGEAAAAAEEARLAAQKEEHQRTVAQSVSGTVVPGLTAAVEVWPEPTERPRIEMLTGRLQNSAGVLGSLVQYPDDPLDTLLRQGTTSLIAANNVLLSVTAKGTTPQQAIGASAAPLEAAAANLRQALAACAALPETDPAHVSQEKGDAVASGLLGEVQLFSTALAGLAGQPTISKVDCAGVTGMFANLSGSIAAAGGNVGPGAAREALRRLQRGVILALEEVRIATMTDAERLADARQWVLDAIGVLAAAGVPPQDAGAAPAPAP